MTKLSEYMHTSDAAEYLGVHHNTIRKWASRGDLPMHRNPVNGYRRDCEAFQQAAKEDPVSSTELVDLLPDKWLAENPTHRSNIDHIRSEERTSKSSRSKRA